MADDLAAFSRGSSESHRRALLVSCPDEWICKCHLDDYCWDDQCNLHLYKLLTWDRDVHGSSSNRVFQKPSHAP
jgi:hypothetical protein